MSDVTSTQPTKSTVVERSLLARHRLDTFFVIFCVLTAFFSLVVLATLIIAILWTGLPTLDWRFISSLPGDTAETTGIRAALLGSIWICGICAVSSLPIGVATAIFLEEFKPTNPFVRFLHAVIQLNITNLAGVPSVVYGVIGLTAFVALFGIFGPNPNDPAFEFGLQQFAQFGIADSNNERLVLIKVNEADEQVDIQPGMAMETSEGIGGKVNLIGPWEPVPDDEKVQAFTLRKGSEPTRVEEDGEFFDELVTASGDTVRIAVDGESAPPTPIEPGLRGAPGSPRRIIVIGSADLPEINIHNEATSERVAIDGKYYDEYRTSDNVPIRISVPTENSPVKKLEDGMRAIALSNLAVEIKVLEGRPRRSKLRSNLNATVRSQPVGGPFSKPSWYYVRLPFGRSVLAGGLTLMLVILPVVIIASQEALRSVPDSLREGALGMGATPWQVVWNVTLPASLPGIMTGSILSMSRAIGEAAPILIICGIVFVPSGPRNLMDDFTAMPLQIYNWTSQPQEEYEQIAASGIIVLLGVLLSFNAIAIFLRQKLQKPLS